MRPFYRLALVVQLITVLAGADSERGSDLLTVAESSAYRATATSAQVSALLAALDQRSPLLSILEIGRTNEGRPIEMAVIADPPVENPEQAHATGKVITLAFGNIHAGEVCGKEALLMLARELTTTDDHELLRDHVLLLVPNYNADGNDRVSPDNRPGQVGPELGMGQRANAQGFDLNRDWVKLEAPETRALVRVLTDWSPHIVVDTHTTNGSHHRYPLTYDGPTNPASHPELLQLVNERLLPDVTESLRLRTGDETFFYGNFNRAHTIWSTYSAGARYSVPYMGLRGHAAILSEAYAYIPYRQRIIVTLEFVREILTWAGAHHGEFVALMQRVRDETTQAGDQVQPDDVVALRSRVAAHRRLATVLGYEMEAVETGWPRPTEVLRDHDVVHLGRFEPVVSVRRPYAYIIPPGLDPVTEKLRQHGITVEPFEGAAVVEEYEVTSIRHAEREFQGHRLVTLNVHSRLREMTVPSGSVIVRTAQPLGTLAVYLLEPRSDDGLAAWNLLDKYLNEGGIYPVRRVRDARDLD